MCMSTQCAPVRTKKVSDSHLEVWLPEETKVSTLLPRSPSALLSQGSPAAAGALPLQAPRIPAPLLARSGEGPVRKAPDRDPGGARSGARVYLDLHSHRSRTPARGRAGAHTAPGQFLPRAPGTAASGWAGSPPARRAPRPLRAAPSLLPASGSRHVRSPLPPAPSGTRERVPTALS